jgi:8-oxo-dGTP pyrophosphatase MutT (NUDIX family)
VTALPRLRSVLAGFTPRSFPRVPEVSAHRAAAVLVPVVAHEAAAILFTQRAANMRAHGGQISFPGGKIDPGDASPEAAALREAHEELGLRASDVEIVGRLSEWATPSGFLITPVVGIVAPDAPRMPNPIEVAEAFEIPVATLRDPAVCDDRGQIERWGMTFPTYAYRTGDRFIWGATARLLRELLELWPA